ncbi:MAG TPA: WYL domain-containing protein [Holophagaceae bacterium]
MTRTPRKKTGTAEAPKASKAAPKKPAAKAVQAKTAAEKPAPKKTPAKKAVAKTAETEAKPVRKAKAVATPEPEAVVPAPPEPAPKAAPKAPARKAAGSEPAIPPFAEAVLAAIREGRALEFIFADSDANAPRTFEPRQLTYDALSQAWYVWGWDRRYNAERFHRLDLLAEVNPVEGVGRAAQGPYAEGTPANQIGGWLGGEPIAVKALLMKQWVFAVKQAPPAFPHFRMEDQGDGQALVTFTATDLRAIARWVLQFGDGIQVQEPARLQDRIKQVAAVWMGKDRQALPAPRPEAPRHEPRPEPRAESRPDHRPARPEPAQEPRRHEARPPREPRREQEEEAPKGKPGKLEIIRFDRL